MNTKNRIDVNDVLEVIKAITLEIPEPTFAADHYTALALRTQLLQTTVMVSLIQELRHMHDTSNQPRLGN